MESDAHSDEELRRVNKHKWLHVRHNAHEDTHQCEFCLLLRFTPFARWQRMFEIPGKRIMKPTKAAQRVSYTPLQSHDSKTHPGETPYDFNRDYGCPGESKEG